MSRKKNWWVRIWRAATTQRLCQLWGCRSRLRNRETWSSQEEGEEGRSWRQQRKWSSQSRKRRRSSSEPVWSQEERRWPQVCLGLASLLRRSRPQVRCSILTTTCTIWRWMRAWQTLITFRASCSMKIPMEAWWLSRTRRNKFLRSSWIWVNQCRSWRAAR